MTDFVMMTLSMMGINPPDWQWYRRWKGGHWERCWVEVCWGYVWMQLDHDKAANSAIRRYSTMERLDRCEDW